jgi:hypothetical protein
VKSKDIFKIFDGDFFWTQWAFNWIFGQEGFVVDCDFVDNSFLTKFVTKKKQFVFIQFEIQKINFGLKILDVCFY